MCLMRERIPRSRTIRLRSYRWAIGKLYACGGGVRRKYGYIRRLHPPAKQETSLARVGIPSPFTGREDVKC